MNRLYSMTLVLMLFSSAAFAFSPYENYLLSSKPAHAGLLARAKAGQDEALSGQLSKLCSEDNKDKFEKSGISNISAFKKRIHNDTWYLVHFQYSGDKQYLTAAKTFESLTPKLKDLIEPNLQAARYDCVWLQAEWINYIRGLDVDREPTSLLSMVTTIKPEREAEYRSLHQTVWPGVVDQMIRGNNRNFSIFLAEIDGVLYEFFYLEYMGTDPEKDNRMNNSDPVNKRWWSHTDPCQQPLEGEQFNWTALTRITDPKPEKESQDD